MPHSAMQDTLQESVAGFPSSDLGKAFYGYL